MEIIKVYDIVIAEGEFAGYYFMTDIGRYNPEGAYERALKLLKECESIYGSAELRESEVEVVRDPYAELYLYPSRQLKVAK